MEPQLVSLIAASVAFVGLHFVMSHPLRAGMIRSLGENGFMGVYSLLTLAAFAWMVVAFRAVPAGAMPVWDGTGPMPWAIASILTLIAMTLLLGSMRGNPALPQVGADVVAAAQAEGVYTVTRHPMMWGVALWAAAHSLIAPTPRVLVLMGAMAVLALVGSHLQDRKKAVLLGDAWAGWEAKTSFWPRLGGLARIHPVLWVVAIVAWLAATFGHIHAVHVTAGVWRWL